MYSLNGGLLMTSKRIIASVLALCITAILVIAVCGCEDLGTYEDTTEYYASFGDVVFLGGAAGEGKSYSVEKYFYNEESRENFLTGKDGVYGGVQHSDYVYVAIPFNTDINMDSLAMYLQAKSDVTLYVNVYITDTLPENWETLEDNLKENITEDSTDSSVETSAETSEEPSDDSADEDAQEYDDPDPATRVGEIAMYLKGGEWNSFTLDSFMIDGKNEKTIYVKEGQYILLQIRNNSGVRVFDEENQLYVDPTTGLALDKAEITMTNLLIRALEIDTKAEAKEGEE